MSVALRFKRFVMIGVLLCGAGASAAPQQLIDNWNPAACGFTDVAAFSLAGPVHLQRLDIWYRWNVNEISVQYSVAQDGVTIAEGSLVRADCDPRQPTWCTARVEPGADLDPGTYVVRTAHARICQNAGSQGRGFIRIFGTRR